MIDVKMDAEGVWRCRAAECRAPLARYAGWGGKSHSRTRVEPRTELVRMPSPDGMPTYGRSRQRAKDHRSDWTGKSPEYRGFALLPIRVHCVRCGRAQVLRRVLPSVAPNTEVL